MKDKALIMVAACMAATMLNGCSGSQSGEPEQLVDTSIRFVATIPGESPSRAGETYTSLENLYSDFGVVAFKQMDDNSVQQVIRHEDATPYQTQWLDEAWKYDLTSIDGYLQYLRYWDTEAAQYTFSAYSPYTIGSDPATDTHNIAIANDGALSISDISAHVDPADAIDWLTAKHRRTNGDLADYDLLAADPSIVVNTPAKLTDRVPLIFHHILSMIDVRVYLGTDIDPLTITDVRLDLMQYDEASDTYFPVKISTRGDYNDGAWNYSTNSADKAPSLLDLTGLSIEVNSYTRATSVEIATRLEIPQDVSNLYVLATVITDRDEHQAYFPFKSGWDPDKLYTYYLVIGKNAIILVDLDIMKYHWRPGNDIDIDPPLNNW